MNNRILVVVVIVASMLMSCSKDQLPEMRNQKRIIGKWIRQDGHNFSSSNGETSRERISYRFHEDGTFIGEYVDKIPHESLLLTTETTYTGKYELLKDATVLNLMEEGNDPVVFEIRSVTKDALTLQDKQGKTAEYIKQVDE